MTKAVSQDATSSQAIDKAADASLATLRGQVDEIDNALLDLLAKRQALSRQIVTKKAAGSNVFRPDREVSLLRNLLANHKAIDARLIMGLWRHIISASIAEQKPDYTIAHSPAADYLAATHGAGYMKLAPQQDVRQAINQLAKGQVDCVIVTEDEMASHADLLKADEAVIAASIGFLVQDGQERGYVLCREMPLPSGDDMIVIRLADNRLSHHDAADKTPLPKGDIVGQYARPITLGPLP